MKKILLIGWKDLLVAFRDRAIILMLLAPFVLTLAMGFVTGSFSEGRGGIEDIPVVIVNKDKGVLGNALLAALESQDRANLLKTSIVSSAAVARTQVEDDEAAAAVIIPEGFSDGILSAGAGSSPQSEWVIEIYANPARLISTGVVRSLVDSFMVQVETGLVGGQVVASQLVAGGLVSIQEAPAVGQKIGARLAELGTGEPLVSLEPQAEDLLGSEDAVNPLAILAPNMALLFLMYTVSSVGGRSILAERQEGTIARLLSTPTSSTQVLGGKVAGVLLTGVAQLVILITASSLLFSIRWGDPLAVVVLVLAAVAAASGWGILLAALASTPAQVGSMGTAMMLIFGILGGSFFGGETFPGWLGTLAKITPNAWAGEAFKKLALGRSLGDILNPIAALLVMALVLFGVAVVAFRRRGITAN